MKLGLISTLKGQKKNCVYVFLIFLNCYLSNISEVLKYIFTLFDPKNMHTILLIFIEKKTKKKVGEWVSLCCTVGYKWVNVMDGVKLYLMI